MCSLAFGFGGCGYPAGLEPESALPAAVPASPAPTGSPGFAPGPVPATSPASLPTPETAAPGATSPGADGYVLPSAPAPATSPPAAPPMPPSEASDAPAPVPGAGSGAGSSTGPGASGDLALLSGPAIYLVAIDDGGSRGARFGCNDSLVAVRSGPPGSPASGSPAAATAQDPMETAMTRLLAPDGVPAASGLYNALAGSTLKYVSGRLDETTAVVDLSGELRQGGVCDSPRIEAQLTQTAIAASGASRAEIRINGRPLAEFLDLR
ncbi:GerMN domain-containing protein [Arthrobacter sp. R-11]|uniref:GerMN domain-containing protein n=1 Tax=Arthrobacter sp. R-11 TaxID=3404053 RepID=UPI003CE88E54